MVLMLSFFTALSTFFDKLTSHGLSKSLLAVHGYLLLVSVLVNSMMFLLVSGFSLDQIYAGSVIPVPNGGAVVQEMVLDDVNLLEAQLNTMSVNFQKLQEEQQVLEQTLESEMNKPPQKIVERIEVPLVTERIVVHEKAIEKEISSPLLVSRDSGPSFVRRSKGEMVVVDSSCLSGYALVNPRLVRRCATDDDIL